MCEDVTVASRVKMSHEMQSYINEQKQYGCVSFLKVANMAAKNVKSCKLVFNWVQKVWKDLPKTVQYEGYNVEILGQRSCNNSIGN